MHIRPINPDSTDEITLVAARMRQTLCEVLGVARGESMYSMAWLIGRMRWHLDPDSVIGQVFLAENAAGDIVGHTIVRLEPVESDGTIGLFSTTYVAPDARRQGVAARLLRQGEQWMRDHGMAQAVTYTDQDNVKLQTLYRRHGYRMTPMPDAFVKLSKPLD